MSLDKKSRHKENKEEEKEEEEIGRWRRSDFFADMTVDFYIFYSSRKKHGDGEIESFDQMALSINEWTLFHGNFKLAQFKWSCRY